MDWARSRPRPAMDWAAMDWARNGPGGNDWARNGLGTASPSPGLACSR